MSDTLPQIAVLGMGLTTSLGRGVSENWAAVTAGKSGAKIIDRFDTSGLPTRFAATLPYQEMPGRWSLRDHVHAVAREVLLEAMAEADWPALAQPGVRTSLFMSTPHTEPFLGDRIAARLAPDDAIVSQRLRYGLIGGSHAELLKREFRFGGIPVNVSTACASSASAIQIAVESLRRNDIDIAVVVAADVSVHAEGMLRFSLLSALSTRNDSPSTASRPFTASRDGFVMGEGAAALILVREQDAATGSVLARVAGCGDATDNFHRTRSHPSGDRIVASMASALEDAGLSSRDLNYINAHGTSTPENDKMEALGISRLCETHPAPPVSSSKSMIGHTLCAAGIVEAVITILAIRNSVLPPTINHQDPDTTIELDVVPNSSRVASVKFALSNSFGFGGQNVSLVLAAR